MKHTITLASSGETFQCQEGESILHALARLGKRGIPIGCRGGGCGVCKVRLITGDYLLKPMSRNHITEQDICQGIVLGCRVFPQSDIELEPIEKLERILLKAG